MKTSKISDIGFYHMGNGYSVADRTREERGDYVKIAHINHDRTIKWYKPEIVTEEVKKHIQFFADTDDGQISATQTTKVFSVPPFGLDKDKNMDEPATPLTKTTLKS